MKVFVLLCVLVTASAEVPFWMWLWTLFYNTPAPTPLPTSAPTLTPTAAPTTVTCGPNTVVVNQQCVPQTDFQGQLAGTELTEPIRYESVNGKLHVELVMDLYDYSDPFYECPWGMRMYNGMAPGPTIVVKKGDQLTIRLRNNMLPIQPERPVNNVRDPNVTNLHTHGLHITANEPQDNVVLPMLQGKEDYNYTYDIFPQHMPGHHWYHPHHHGSTALQTAQAYGSLIVENEDYGFDQENMPFPLRGMRNIYAAIGAPDFKIGRSAINDIMVDMGIGEQQCTPRPGVTVPTELYRLVNKQYQPFIHISPHEPLQVDMLNNDGGQFLQLKINSEDEVAFGCSMHLMTKDGIPIKDAPRLLTQTYMVPGSRASVVFMCERTGTVRLHDVTSTMVPPMTIFTLKVGAVTFSSDHPGYAADASSISALAPLAVRWPDYLGGNADNGSIRQRPVDKTNTLLYEVNGVIPDNIDKYPHKQNDSFFFKINNKLFEDSEPMEQIPYDSIIKTKMVGTEDAQAHPHHQHIWPFELTALPSNVNDVAGNWYQLGDWHDTYGFPHQNETEFTEFTWYTKNHPMNLMIFHCHILHHEDQGMMSWYDVP